MAVTINASTSSGVITTADNSGVLQLQTNNGTTAMTIDTSQNVGIGTSSPVGSMQLLRSSDPQFIITDDFSSSFSFGTTTGYSTIGTDAAAITFKTGVSTGSVFSTGTERMRIDSSGNVGIGGTGAYKLNVISDLGMGLYNSAGTSVGIFTPGSTFQIANYFSTGSNITFSTNPNGGGNAERMRIDSSGFVLVGTTVLPTTSVSSNGVGIYSAGGVAGRINYGKTLSGTENSMANYHAGNYVGGVTYSNTATAFPTSSDVRLKKDIVDAPNSLDKINAIRIVSHGWKHDDDIVEYGVVAQELYNIAPQAVLKGDDGKEVVNTWSVDYSKLVPILVKAVQEQQTIINELKSRIEVLEGAK